MIQDNTPDFHRQQAELARQYRLQPRKDDMNATENIAACPQPVSAGGKTTGATDMTTQQPEALRLAEQYDHGDPATYGNAWKAAVCAELRRQHARITDIEAQLEAIGAGGVSGPLIGQPQAMPDLSQLTERGAKAWAGVDAQGLREGGADMSKERDDLTAFYAWLHTYESEVGALDDGSARVGFIAGRATPTAPQPSPTAQAEESTKAISGTQKQAICDACGSELLEVLQSPNSYLSAEQFDADKLGDWYCKCCPKGPSNGSSTHRYFWNRDLGSTAAQSADSVQEDAARVFTYKNQPCNNVTAWRFGEACRAAQPGGDPIDHGLSLLQKLQERGYGIVAIDATRKQGATK